MEEGLHKPVEKPAAPVATQDIIYYAIAVDAPMAIPAGAMEDDIKTGEWAVDLCGCFTHCIPNCCMAFFCPCISLAQVSARLGIASFTCTLVWLLLSLSISGGVTSAMLFLWIWHARSTTRERFRIPGDCFADCCVSFWCSSCALAQMATHVKSYKPGSCSFGPPDILPAFQ
jgi:Cys-rich protein (TIGR01571 family)